MRGAKGQAFYDGGEVSLYPLLRQTLPGGSQATVSLTPEATVVAVGDEHVYSYDLCGRPFALVRDGWTARRALSGRVLLKRAADAVAPRERRRIEAHEAAPFLDSARREAADVLRAIEGARDLDAAARDQALGRLAGIVAMDAPALAEDARRFEAECGRVGILPPDQYLSLVLRLTEGCSWNACTFCSLYRDVPFRVRTPTEMVGHIASVRAFFGPSRALRRSIFLGDANALCVGHDRLLPLLETVAQAFPLAPRNLTSAERRAWLLSHPDGTSGLFAFVDAWTGHRKAVDEYRAYAALGLKRVYVGLETGDAALLGWLQKPGDPQDAVALVAGLHAAGIAAGVIVLLGAGGQRFDATHVAATAAVLEAMRLGPADIVYFSEFVEEEGLEYGHRAAGGDLRPLTPERCREQRRAILNAWRPLSPAPRIASYDIREFVY
jgi:radical SAM superfamily enzyme YgiQ (UPF0313 family)